MADGGNSLVVADYNRSLAAPAEEHQMARFGMNRVQAATGSILLKTPSDDSNRKMVEPGSEKER